MNSDSRSSPAEIRLCHIDDLPVGVGKAFDVAGRPIAVFKSRDGKVACVEGTCPHRNGSLADGMVIHHIVTCLLHGAGFDLNNGACDRPELRSINVYPVRIEADWIIMGLAAKKA